uniref:EngB-type G domain-containing protein n=1 Tax=Dunaliella tertiolecta TaxID=3047 RepID=A0A7S3VSQ8_DUNTE
METLRSLSMRGQARAKPADLQPVPLLERALQVPCRRARRYARMLPLACSMSPSPQPLAREESNGQALQQQQQQLQQQAPLTLYPDEEGEDEELASDNEDDEDEVMDAGSNSGSSYSLTSMLQGALLPEIFANVHADGSLPQATYTRIRKAEYVSSCVDHKACPVPPQHAEFAVIGRSNVGKSSLINMLTGSRRLAKVSKEPGKTQCINHFLINDSWYLVDLPGFGYAKRNSLTRSLFDKFTRSYFLERPSLAMVYLLVDCSISPQKMDLQYADWLFKNKVPLAIVFTKADKRRKKGGKHEDNVQAFKHALLHDRAFPALPPCVVTSAEKGYGRTPLLHLTASLRQAFQASGILDKAMLEWQRAQIGATHTIPEEGAAIAGAASSATAASAADRSVSEGKGVGVDAQPHLQGSSRSNDGSSEGSSFSTPVHDGDVVGGGQGRGSSGTNVSSTSGLQGQGEACSSSSSSTSGADHAHSSTYNGATNGSHNEGVNTSAGLGGSKEVSSGSSSYKPGLAGWSEAEIRARVKQRSLLLKQQQEMQAKNVKAPSSLDDNEQGGLEGREKMSGSRGSPSSGKRVPRKVGKVGGRASRSSSSSSSSRNAGSVSSKGPKNNVK